MPIYEYECISCYTIFERIVMSSDLKKAPAIEATAICDECGNMGYRIASVFSFNKIGPVSGIDDTDDLTLGKIVQERGIPAEFRPTIDEIKIRENRKQMDREYRERVKKYDLDKPTKVELELERKNSPKKTITI